MAAQTPYPGYAAKRPIGSSPGGTVAPVSIAPPGFSRMAAQTPYPGYAAKRPIGSLSLAAP
jgi:hypothetical protein